jgi:hypothetical protein
LDLLGATSPPSLYFLLSHGSKDPKRPSQEFFSFLGQFGKEGVPAALLFTGKPEPVRKADITLLKDMTCKATANLLHPAMCGYNSLTANGLSKSIQFKFNNLYSSLERGIAFGSAPLMKMASENQVASTLPLSAGIFLTQQATKRSGPGPLTVGDQQVEIIRQVHTFQALIRRVHTIQEPRIP